MLKLMKQKVNIFIALMVAWICILPTVDVCAATQITVTQSGADEKEAYLFVDGISGEVEQVYGYIGSETVTDVEWKRVKESETEIKTLVLMDTSLSIKSEIKEHFKEMLKTLVENKLPNESIAIATYGRTPKYLCDYQTDSNALLQVIDSISYQKQNSFLYQSIYDIVVDFNELNDKCLKRIIIFSDGDDTNSEGVSKTEVLTLLDKTRYPIYAIGCTKDTNADSLKDFFALSRITGAKSLKFSQETTEDEMKDIFSSVGDFLQIKIVPAISVMDGGMKNITLEIATASDVYQVSTDVRVGRVVSTEVEAEDVEEPEEEPIDVPETDTEDVSGEEPEKIPEETTTGDIAGETAEDTVTSEEEEQEAVVTNSVVTKTPEVKEPEEQEKATESKTGGSPIKVVAIIVLILAVAGLGIYFVLKKGKEQKTVNGSVIPQVGQPVAPQAMQPAGPQMIPDNTAYPAYGMNSYAQDASYHGLEVILEDTVNKQNISIRLSDYAEGRFISIGRNREKCDVTIDYDGGISQLHCVMYMAGNSIFVEDCQSTNHTYLNGNQVMEPESIAEGDVLTLGKVKFIVHIVLR